MAYLRSLAAKVFHRSRTWDDMEEELRSHLQHRADDLERSGLPRAEAERRDEIVARFQLLIAQNGEGAVLY